MIRKLLIANRGEIACRIISTARSMGVSTVAVYSDADAGAAHVALADEAVHLGGSAPAQSYLNAEALLAAARRTGAEAVHPGYGFLSENPDFVEAVAAAGLVFVGPPASAIRQMGLKDAAKRLMEAAGVPVVPGYHGAEQSPERLAEEADRIGYPVLIKAVAGGGGKGMRRVDAPEDFASALASARAEARTAFGNADVLVERYVRQPRHIELQIFGDTHGNVVHLFERDCSLQRRHQKVIEEAPAPGMTEEMRAAMGQAAVRAAQAIGYVGAGTVEFIVEGGEVLRPDGFWFMEMNTRLQVEHPVTEAVTGLDLVEWQLRVASGEKLPLAQEEIRCEGHAFEARLYAEDVPAGFLPATGRLAHLRFSDLSRNDSGVREGDEISPWYDPMIAKVITHGPSRGVALARLSRALEQTEVGGTVTNIAFLEALSRHEGFAAGRVDTGLIDRDLDSLVRQEAPPAAVLACAALAASGMDAPPADFTGFSLWAPLQRTVVLERDGKQWRIGVAIRGADRVEIEIEEEVLQCRRGARGWLIGEARAPGPARLLDGAVVVFAGQPWEFALPDPLARESAEAMGGNIVEAPMPGLVREVLVQPGQMVERGDRLVILEAMKMEHALSAVRAGRVEAVLVEAGAQVAAHDALVLLDPEEAGGAE
ncbi:acetyl/propionyl/methylcrotonyl-CoA carboxylase subunit alpha [Aliiruegeria sabulilitoris]|uniref:acetyl/propionyl/methylcrotonyl-CoA carboxylase subunit alpha n=1 Tax=Aliiruegeria sabulilitoris TaxID=1510458 RepID=UPI00082FBBA2|nr:acetyl/propionyl/methylcrotonyl-CoA carboxylase subunit alpha [Aliiruegeria sabulilitoris]NDR56410.1 acetyl/propionyl/methylcrotonyl-CoA carboxylase subunit alpha [Pseudoruegeria sp. M32A2M]